MMHYPGISPTVSKDLGKISHGLTIVGFVEGCSYKGACFGAGLAAGPEKELSLVMSLVVYLVKRLSWMLILADDIKNGQC